MEVRNKILVSAGGKGHLLKWQRTWLQGVLAPELNGKTELMNNELRRTWGGRRCIIQAVVWLHVTSSTKTHEGREMM